MEASDLRSLADERPTGMVFGKMLKWMDRAKMALWLAAGRIDKLEARVADLERRLGEAVKAEREACVQAVKNTAPMASLDSRIFDALERACDAIRARTAASVAEAGGENG